MKEKNLDEFLRVLDEIDFALTQQPRNYAYRDRQVAEEFIQGKSFEFIYHLADHGASRVIVDQDEDRISFYLGERNATEQVKANWRAYGFDQF